MGNHRKATTTETLDSILETLTSGTTARREDHPLVGKLVGRSESGSPVVTAGPGKAKAEARTTVNLTDEPDGSEVLLMFENGDPLRPIIVGVLKNAATQREIHSTEETTITVDGERVVLNGQKEIALRCGKASITLTKSGKVIVRGTYLSSRSTGPHLIRGGSIHLN